MTKTVTVMRFGTSGLRGLSADLVETGASIYVTAFGRHMLDGGWASLGDPILIGRDFRESSPELAAICAAALGRLGFKIFECGTVPTPALAFYGSKLKVASVMVTGSHIPSDRNGIKFYRPDGEIDKGDELAISQLAKTVPELDAAACHPPPHTEDHSLCCLQLYVERNTKLLVKGALAGLKIGVYQHSTVARDLIVELLSHFGADVVALGRSETFVPVDTEAVSNDTIQLFREWVRAHGLDAIVSADGDGDRPLIGDETGKPLRGDLIGVMTAQFLGAGAVVTPVTSNSGIEALGFSVTRTKVGSPFVVAGMREAVAAANERVMGFEANGGVLTAHTVDLGGYSLEALPTRDSILPILAVLSLLTTQEKPLSAITQSYRLPAAVSDRLENFPVEAGSALMSHLRASADNLAAFLGGIGDVASVSDIDGIRIMFQDGQTIHFRPSGNAPEMRCYAESATERLALELLSVGLMRLKLWGDSAQRTPTAAYREPLI